MARGPRVAPTAEFAPFPPGYKGTGAARLIIIRTGRGDVRVDPDEAEVLAAELRAAAGQARRGGGVNNAPPAGDFYY